MNDTALKACRFIFLSLSAVLCLIACILLIIGVSTASWMTVSYPMTNGNVEEHRHGLWLDCILSGSAYSMQNSYNFFQGSNYGGNNPCEYKWINSGVDQSLVSNPYSSFYGGGMGQGIGNDYGTGGSQIHNSDYSQHRFLGWHVSTLVLLLIAIFCGIVALACSCCVILTGICSPLAALLEFLAFLCSAIGCAVFFINSSRPEISMVQIPFSIDRWTVHDQQRGFSFYLSFASVFLFLLSFLIGILSTVTIVMRAHQNHQRRHLASKTYPKAEITTVSSPTNDRATFLRTQSPLRDHSPMRAHSPAIDV